MMANGSLVWGALLLLRLIARGNGFSSSLFLTRIHHHYLPRARRTTTSTTRCRPRLRVSHSGDDAGVAVAAAKPSKHSAKEKKDPSSFMKNDSGGDAETKDDDDDDDHIGFEEDGLSMFDVLAARAATCLLQSDLKRDAKSSSSSSSSSSALAVPSGATNWLDNASAFALRQTLDRLDLQTTSGGGAASSLETTVAWQKWMQAVPSPVGVDLSAALRHSALTLESLQASLQVVDESLDEFQQRLHCRLLLLPSGASLPQPLVEPPGSVIYGKLLYGGVIRSRVLPSSRAAPPRQAGVRRQVTKTRAAQRVPAWMQFGGASRLYQSVDMGPAAVLELLLMPRATVADAAAAESSQQHEQDGGRRRPERLMTIDGFGWHPTDMFDFVRDDGTKESDYDNEANGLAASSATTLLSGQERNDAFRATFQSSVGGLQPQIDAIVRRVLDGRIIRPAEDADNKDYLNGGESSSQAYPTDRDLAVASREAETLALLGLEPVRGLLLYGPPGCGKTVLAREIAKALQARAPKIVAAPELLDRWVGGSEKLVRALFADAEAELAACRGDARRSALHVLVIDEIDAVFRRRTASDDSGESTRSSVVNQILSKLDGVRALPNVLLIGMTNRRELLDPALLRPGRLEVQVEIPLPDSKGRREILNIHFGPLRHKGRLSRPLCCAIDGVPTTSTTDGGEAAAFLEASSTQSASDGNRKNPPALQRALRKVVQSFQSSSPRRVFDLAADEATGGCSGADIAGLVRCAGSLALARSRQQDGASALDNLLVTLEDVKQALQEVKDSR